MYKPQGKGDKTSDWGQWGQAKKKGRPHKVDQYGQKIYRASTSIYIDVRLKEWITAKAGNLSDWIETMVRSAYQKEYCFYCFDDDIEEVMHGWVCRNDKHRMKAGNGAPSVVVAWKNCAFCESSFENSMVVVVDNTEKGGKGSGAIKMCRNCAKEHMLLEAK